MMSLVFLFMGGGGAMVHLKSFLGVFLYQKITIFFALKKKLLLKIIFVLNKFFFGLALLHVPVGGGGDCICLVKLFLKQKFTIFVAVKDTAFENNICSKLTFFLRFGIIVGSCLCENLPMTGIYFILRELLWKDNTYLFSQAQQFLFSVNAIFFFVSGDANKRFKTKVSNMKSFMIGIYSQTLMNLST